MAVPAGRRSGLILFLVLFACEIPEPDRDVPAPQVEVFEARPLRVRPGQSTRLAWRITGEVSAARLELPNRTLDIEVSNGVVVLTPNQDLEAILAAEGPGGTTRARARVSVGVDEALRVVGFSVVPKRLRPTEAVRVSWDTEGASRVVLLEDARELARDLPLRGSYILRPTDSLTVALRVEGIGGPLTRRETVEVVGPPVIISAFQADPPEVSEGETVRLVWAVAQASSVEILRFEEGGPEARFYYEEPAADSGALQVELQPGVYRFRLVASGVDIAEADIMVRVQGTPIPLIRRFSVTPTVTGPGGEVRVAWSVASADAVRLELGSLGGAAVPPAGERRVVLDPRSQTFRLVATRESGLASRSIDVTVDPLRPSIESFDAAPSRTGPGERVTVRWGTMSADRLWVSDDLGRVRLSRLPESGVSELFPQNPLGLRLTAANPRGETSKSLVLAVGRRPRILSFAALDREVRVGRPVRWKYATEGAHTRILSTPGRSPPLVLTAESGTVALRKTDVPTSPDGTLSAQSDLFAVSATASVNRLPAAVGALEAEPNERASIAHVVAGSRFEGILVPGDIDFLVMERQFGLRKRITLELGPQMQVRLQALDNEGSPIGPIRTQDPWVPSTTLEGELALMPGFFALVVSESPRSPPLTKEQPYRLRIEDRIPRCGDGIVDRIEDCDDGNPLNGDGCSAACRREGLGEIEPNQNRTTAAMIQPGGLQAFLHSDDMDWFRFFVAEPARAGSWEVLLTDANGQDCSLDAIVKLVDGSGRPVAEDDGEGLGCPRLRGPETVLGSGTWYISVEPGAGRVLAARGQYRLGLTAPP